MIGSTAGLILGGLSAAGSLAGGFLGKGGADAAAAGANAAGQQAFNAAFSQQQQNTSNLSPWMSTGTNAVSLIGSLLGFGSLWNRGGEGATYNLEPDPNAQANAQAQFGNFLKMYPGYSQTFKKDPGYQFRLAQGQKALDRSAASKGRLYSGAQLQATTDYNQNFASNEYGNWFTRANAQYGNALDRLFATAGMGQNAATSLAGANSGLVSNANNALVSSAGNAGNATMAGANAFASGIGSATNNALLAGILSGAFKGGGGGSSYGTPGSDWWKA